MISFLTDPASHKRRPIAKIFQVDIFYYSQSSLNRSAIRSNFGPRNIVQFWEMGVFFLDPVGPFALPFDSEGIVMKCKLDNAAFHSISTWHVVGRWKNFLSASPTAKPRGRKLWGKPADIRYPPPAESRRGEYDYRPRGPKIVNSIRWICAFFASKTDKQRIISVCYPLHRAIAR